MSSEEQRELFRRYQQTKDPSVRQRLVEAYTNLVYFLARKFINRGEPLEDVVQVGFVGLLMAIERFDPERGLEFSTFATPTIVGEIKRYFRDKSWAVRIPRRLQELNARSRLKAEEMQHKLGRAPSVQELAESLGTSEEELLAAYEASPAQQTVPLDSPPSADAEATSLADRLGAADENLERVELQGVLDSAMAHLTPREREIMYLRFIEELPQSEVARRLGISQMHVSRLQRAAVEHIRSQLPADVGV
ncbi:MAG TPA: SigB/SigF/SigG family RNA polymerase sigma factor [Candidatus Dormibacteraeota bacterium]|jgi:RNA polymerase sigma-B factor|nr:SigB/SigF/SigG family RNA polymerase sigma factor [Candidatus Dormibacteraeota bacterium]